MSAELVENLILFLQGRTEVTDLVGGPEHVYDTAADQIESGEYIVVSEDGMFDLGDSYVGSSGGLIAVVAAVVVWSTGPGQSAAKCRVVQRAIRDLLDGYGAGGQPLGSLTCYKAERIGVKGMYQGPGDGEAFGDFGVAAQYRIAHGEDVPTLA